MLRELPSTLIGELYQREDVERLVIESEDVQRRRDGSRRMYDALLSAQQLMGRILLK